MAAAFAVAVSLPGYALRKLGAGDVKMLVAIGLLTSLPVTLHTFAVAALLGAAVALMWLWLDRWQAVLGPLMKFPRFAAWLGTDLRRKKMPFGLLLAIGLMTAVWGGASS